MTRERLWLILKLTVSLALLGLLLGRVDRAQVAALLLEANPMLLGLAFAATVVAWLLNTYKWRQLLRALGHQLAYRDLLALNYIGVFYSLVLPGQVSGEVMKGLRLTQSGCPAAHGAVSIGVDRLTGVLALGVLGLAGLLAAPQIDVSRPLLWFAAAVTGLSAGALLFVAARPPRMGGWFPRARPFSYVRSLLSTLWQALAAYGNARSVLLRALVLAVGFQVLVTFSNYLAALAVGVEVPFMGLVWIVALVSLVHMLPVSFAGLGVREGAYVFFLSQYGVPLASGLSLSLAIFGLILLQGVVGGALEVLSPKLALGSYERQKL